MTVNNFRTVSILHLITRGRMKSIGVQVSDNQADHKVIAKLWKVRQTTCQPCLAKNGYSHPAYRACATGRPSQACLGPRADFRLPCSPASVLVEDMAALEVLFPLFTAREMRLLFYAWRAFLFHLSYFRYKVEAGKESHPLSWSY